MALKRPYRTFAEARAFVRNLGLTSESAWRTYAKSPDKPVDIPANPKNVYRAEYMGTGDWLGTRTGPAPKPEYRPFAEAREFVRRLGLKSHGEWLTYARS